MRASDGAKIINQTPIYEFKDRYNMQCRSEPRGVVRAMMNAHVLGLLGTGHSRLTMSDEDEGK